MNGSEEGWLPGIRHGGDRRAALGPACVRQQSSTTAAAAGREGGKQESAGKYEGGEGSRRPANKLIVSCSLSSFDLSVSSVCRPPAGSRVSDFTQRLPPLCVGAGGERERDETRPPFRPRGEEQRYGRESRNRRERRRGGRPERCIMDGIGPALDGANQERLGRGKKRIVTGWDSWSGAPNGNAMPGLAGGACRTVR